MGFNAALYALGACWQLALVLGQPAENIGQDDSLGSLDGVVVPKGNLSQFMGPRSGVLDDSIVPRVDLSWPEEVVARAVKRAADTGGFFYLINHGISEEVFHNTVREAHRFFSQPPRTKREISSLGYGGGSVATKGYTPPFSEGSYEKDATDARPEEERATGQRNTRESLVFRFPEEQDVKHEPYFADYAEFLRGLHAEGSTHDARLHLGHRENRVASPLDIGPAARRFFLKNQWPSEGDLPGFRETVERYFGEMRKLADKTFALFSRVLAADAAEHGSRSNASVAGLQRDKGMMTFNLVHYPPAPAQDDHSMGIADHTDWELFTLLLPMYLEARHVDSCVAEGGGAVAGSRQDCASLGRNPNVDPETGVAYTGLEVWYKDAWVAVPHIPGAIIVNQGDMLSRLSQRSLKAPVHRVRAQNDFERYSLISFWAPNYDVLLPDPDLPCGKVLAGEHYLKRNNFVSSLTV